MANRFLKLMTLASMVLVFSMLLVGDAIGVDSAACSDRGLVDVDEAVMLQMWADTVPRSEDRYPFPPSLPTAFEENAQRQRHSPVYSPLEQMPHKLSTMQDSVEKRPRTLTRFTMEPQQWGTPYPPESMQSTHEMSNTNLKHRRHQVMPSDQTHHQSLSGDGSQFNDYGQQLVKPSHLLEMSSSGSEADEQAMLDASIAPAMLDREARNPNTNEMGLMQNDLRLETEEKYRQQVAANASTDGSLQSMRNLKHANHALDMENVDLKHALDMQRYQNVADAMARQRREQEQTQSLQAERQEAMRLRQLETQHAQKETQQALEEKQLKDRLYTTSQELDHEHAEAQKAKVRETEKVDWARRVSAQAAQEMKLAKGAEQQAAKAVSELRSAMFKVKKDILETADGTNESFGFTDVFVPAAAGHTSFLEDA